MGGKRTPRPPPIDARGYTYKEVLKYILYLCGHWLNLEVDCRRVRVRRMRVGVHLRVLLRLREAEKY